MQIGKSRERYEECKEGDFVTVGAAARNGLAIRPPSFVLRLIPWGDSEHLVWLKKSPAWDVGHLPLRAPFFLVPLDFEKDSDDWVPADPDAWKTAL